MNKLLMDSTRFMKKHASTILTCIGAIGVVATAVTAVKATPKAMTLLDKAEEKKGEKLTKLEVVTTAAPAYIPAIVTGVATITCIFGANVLNKRQQAALISAYGLVEGSYKEYKDKLKELYGEEAHEHIMDEIAAEKAKDVDVCAPGIADPTFLTDCKSAGEKVLFYDEFGRRYFETTMEQVLGAEYHLNRNFTLRGYAMLNEFYEFLGLEPTKFGSTVGWAIEDEYYWVDFNHRKVTMDDGLECYIIEMMWEPSMDHMDDYWG